MSFIVECPFGLCNRICSIMGHYYVMKKRAEENPDKKYYLYVIWKNNNECNGEFHDVFGHYDDIKLIKEKEEINDKDVEYFRGQMRIPHVLQKYGYKCTYELETIVMKNFKFSDKIIIEGNNFIKKHFSKYPIIGVHMRRTDQIGLATRGGRFTTDDMFYEVIDKKLKKPKFKTSKIYLACDNKQTQDSMNQKYGKRIIHYDDIKEKKSRRKTTLFHAGVDLYLLSKCDFFEGSSYSSFSRIAINLMLAQRNHEKHSFQVYKNNLWRPFLYKGKEKTKIVKTMMEWADKN